MELHAFAALRIAIPEQLVPLQDWTAAKNTHYMLLQCVATSLSQVFVDVSLLKTLTTSLQRVAIALSKAFLDVMLSLLKTLTTCCSASQSHHSQLCVRSSDTVPMFDMLIQCEPSQSVLQLVVHGLLLLSVLSASVASLTSPTYTPQTPKRLFLQHITRGDPTGGGQGVSMYAAASSDATPVDVVLKGMNLTEMASDGQEWLVRGHVVCLPSVHIVLHN